MPQTAQLATLQRASACDDANSPEMNTTIVDIAMDREESMVTKSSHGTDAFMNSVHASQGEMNSLGLLTGSELNESSPTAAGRQPLVTGMVRSRREIGTGSEWKVEMFGPACHLRDYAA